MCTVSVYQEVIIFVQKHNTIPTGNGYHTPLVVELSRNKSQTAIFIDKYKTGISIDINNALSMNEGIYISSITF